MTMDMVNSVLNWVVPPAILVMLSISWPTLTLVNICQWLYSSYYAQHMDNRVVVVTGASSAIGEQIAYEYAKRGTNLVLVARRENRLYGISENAKWLGARNVLVIAADVVKEDDCRRFINETINTFGRLDHLVNTASLGHTFNFEEANDSSVFPILMDINFWGNVYPTYAALPYLRKSHGRIVVNAAVENSLPLPRMSIYSAAKAALVNFYETLRLEVKDEVGITIATHGWIGAEMGRGKFMQEDGADMQLKEEREVQAPGGPVEEFAKLVVSAATRGDASVKFPSWYDVFLLYRVFAPDILTWTFRLLFSDQGTRIASYIGTGRPPFEAHSPPRRLPIHNAPRIQLLNE